MKYIKKVSVIFICLLLAFFIGKTYNVLNVRADSGWDSSYDSSSSSSSSSDSFDDFDSDSNGGEPLTKEDSRNMLIIMCSMMIVPAVFSIILILIIRNVIKSQKNNFSSRGLDLNELFVSNENLISSMINKDINVLKQELFENYKEIQEAWMNFDYDKLRTLCGDELYNSYKTQLETLKLKKQKNVMKDFNLEDIYFINIIKENDVITLSVILMVTQKDYVISENNKVVYGDVNSTMHVTYKLNFEYRKPDTLCCPNCGAKVKFGASKCNYCNSVIIQGKDKFVLVRKEVLNQKKYIIKK